MSKYIPQTAVLHELQQQTLRRKNGLKTGEYIKYPSDDAEDHFVVKFTKLYDKELGGLHEKGKILKDRMDMYLAQVAMFKAEQKAKSVAAEEKKNEN